MHYGWAESVHMYNKNLGGWSLLYIEIWIVEDMWIYSYEISFYLHYYFHWKCIILNWDINFFYNVLCLQVTKATFVCSKNFKKENYRHSLTEMKLLKKDSVPSVFYWSKESKPRTEDFSSLTCNTCHSLCIHSKFLLLKIIKGVVIFKVQSNLILYII